MTRTEVVKREEKRGKEKKRERREGERQIDQVDTLVVVDEKKLWLPDFPALRKDQLLLRLLLLATMTGWDNEEDES